MSVRLLFLTLLTLLLSSCAIRSKVVVEKPLGAAATVELYGAPASTDGELLAIGDSTLFLNYQNSLYKISLSDIEKIHIQHFNPKERKVPGMLLTVLADIGFISLFEEAPVLQGAFVALIPVSVYVFLNSGPKVDFKQPFDSKERSKLCLCSRYPQNLSDAQWSALLHFYRQSEFKRLAPKGR